MSAIETIAQDVFDELVIGSDIPVLVDMWATWCGPCKAMMPALEDLAREYAGEVRIVKVDIDESPLVAQRYGVQSVPTFLLIQGGEVKSRFIGGQTRSKIAAILDAQLASSQ